MKVKKSVKKAQSGDTTRAKNLVTEKKLMPKFIDVERQRVKGPSEKIDTVARKKAIKEGKFYEDPKTGDLFPVRKKAKSGAALKKQAAKAIAMKKAGKAPKKAAKKAMGGMKMMMGGGKCKYGC